MGKKIKLPLETGLSALCNHIRAIKQTAEQSGSAVSSLAQATADSIGEIEDILDSKVDKADIDKIIHGLHAAIFSGEVPAALYSSSGAAITTDGGTEIYAVKKFLTERGE